MRSRALRAVLAVTTLAAYPFASFFPFHPVRWLVPHEVANGAEMLPQGGLRFADPGAMRSRAPPEWLAAAMRSQWLELELRVRWFDPDQTGPARILTLSADPYRRNLTLRQEGTDLVVRLCSAGTDPTARWPKARPSPSSRTCSGPPATWIEIRLGIEPGRLQVSAAAQAGRRRAELVTDLPAAPLGLLVPAGARQRVDQRSPVARGDRPGAGAHRRQRRRLPGAGRPRRARDRARAVLVCRPPRCRGAV
jgi:hypothetical protein